MKKHHNWEWGKEGIKMVSHFLFFYLACLHESLSPGLWASVTRTGWFPCLDCLGWWFKKQSYGISFCRSNPFWLVGDGWGLTWSNRPGLEHWCWTNQVEELDYHHCCTLFLLKSKLHMWIKKHKCLSSVYYFIWLMFGLSDFVPMNMRNAKKWQQLL